MASVVIEEVTKVWNLRGVYGRPIGEDVKARVKKIKSDTSNIPNFRRGAPTGAAAGADVAGWKTIGGGGGGGGGGANTSYGQRQFNTLRNKSGAPVQPAQQHLPPVHEKYVSRFKKVDQPAEEKILNNLILSKLNKFSSETFKDVEQFLCQILDSGETEFIKDFMMLVFRKAAAEEVFCPLYAKLISNLSEKYPQLRDEMMVLYKSYLKIFDDIDTKEKTYRRGYSQFLAELAGLEVLERECIKEVFVKLVERIDASVGGEQATLDEYCDCLLRISKVMKRSTYYKDTKADILSAVASDLERLKKAGTPGVPNKNRFQCMEIYENIS